MPEHSPGFIALIKQLRHDPESVQNFLKDQQSFLSQFDLSQSEIEQLQQIKDSATLDVELDGLIKLIPNDSEGITPGGAATEHPSKGTPTALSIPNEKIPTSGAGFWIATIYFFLVIAYWALSLFFSDALKSLGFPLWGDIHIVIRWIIMIYWFIAGGSMILGIVGKFTGLKRPTRISLWIFIVVLVVIPGSIVLSSLPAATQIIIAQVILILVFTAVPASLYPLFITSKGKTLWEEFMQNLSFLDPVGYRVQEPIFRKKFTALYGQISSEGLGQRILSGEATFPVLLNTLVIGFGWLLFFQTTERNTTITTGVITPFTFGFLGAYLFSLMMLFRRYVQSDLKTTAYTHSSQRILITWVWAFVLTILPWEVIRLDTAYQNQIISVLAFVVGVFPDIAWQVTGRFIKLTLGLVIPSFRQEHPLNEINGITVWVEARLLEENIENIQNLVTTDIPDLMLRTNLPPNRIIDWIDQGILRLHLSKKDSNVNKQILAEFQARGIIKATDILFSHKAFQERYIGVDRFYISRELDPKVETMIDSFEDDTNMYHIRAWREVYAKRTEMIPSAINKLPVKPSSQVNEPEESSNKVSEGG
jgi:hypothetical protein